MRFFVKLKIAEHSGYSIVSENEKARLQEMVNTACKSADSFTLFLSNDLNLDAYKFDNEELNALFEFKNVTDFEENVIKKFFPDKGIYDYVVRELENFTQAPPKEVIPSSWELAWDGYYIYCKNCGYEPSPVEVINSGLPCVCPYCECTMINADELNSFLRRKNNA